MEQTKSMHLYVASHEKDGGICHICFENGAFSPKEKVSLSFPAYMAISGDRLYCVQNHAWENEATGESTVVGIQLKKGFFGAISAPVGTCGVVGCHLSVLDGNVYVANYTSGSFCRLPDRVAQRSGHGTDPVRQDGAHPHCILPAPDGKYLCGTDLGMDEIAVYDPDLNLVSRAALPDGAGPRHLAFSEDGKRLYCVNELNSTISVFSYREGALSYQKSFSVLPADFKGESWASAIRLKDGFLYVSNRGHDSIACLPEKCGSLGRAEFVASGGSYPRDFFLLGDMLFCANERSDLVTAFRLENGRAISTGASFPIPRPLAIVGILA